MPVTWRRGRHCRRAPLWGTEDRTISGHELADGRLESDFSLSGPVWSKPFKCALLREQGRTSIEAIDDQRALR